MEKKTPVYSRGVNPLYMIIESNLENEFIGLLSMSDDDGCIISFYDIKKATDAIKASGKSGLDLYDIDFESLMIRKNKIRFSFSSSDIEFSVSENSDLFGWTLSELHSLIGSKNYFLANYHHILNWVVRPDFQAAG